MADVGDILNNNEFFGDVVDTPQEGIQQQKNREELKSVIDKGEERLLGGKWTYGRVDKTSDLIISKTYAEYKQRELTEKVEKTGKALGKHVINLYSTGISQWLKSKDKLRLRMTKAKTKDDKKLRNDPIIKDQMANLGCLFVCTFGDYLAPVLITAHTFNNVDIGGEPEVEVYENKGP